MLARGAGGQQGAVVAVRFKADFAGLIEQDPVGDDSGLKPGGDELLGDVLGGLVILRRAGDVGLCGEDLEVLASEFGIRHGQEIGIDFGLCSEVGVAEDCLGPSWSGKERKRYQ